MNQVLREQLQSVFFETSRGAARKKIFALRARKDGNTALAALFSAISLSESAQARRFLLQLRDHCGNTTANCDQAFTEEIPATISLYETAALHAETIGDKAMHTACSQSARVQRLHLSLKKKLDRRDTNQESGASVSYHVCQFCGFIMEGKTPENCPICTAPASRFTEIKE